jgi:hypothetical protein
MHFSQQWNLSYTANEGPVRIQYKCLVPIYFFPEKKLLFPKENSVSKFLHLYICEIFIYFQDRLPILLQGTMWTNPGNTVDKLFTDTWMWKLGLRSRNYQKRIHKWYFPCSVYTKYCCQVLAVMQGYLLYIPSQQVFMARHFGGSFWRIYLAGHFGTFIWRVSTSKEKASCWARRKVKEMYNQWICRLHNVIIY